MSTKHYHHHHQHQQVIQHHNASFVQNHYALKIILKTKAGGEEAINVKDIENNNVPQLNGRKTRISNEVYFLICQSYFWCASYISTNALDANYPTTANCPGLS